MKWKTNQNCSNALVSVQRGRVVGVAKMWKEALVKQSYLLCVMNFLTGRLSSSRIKIHPFSLPPRRSSADINHAFKLREVSISIESDKLYLWHVYSHIYTCPVFLLCGSSICLNIHEYLKQWNCCGVGVGRNESTIVLSAEYSSPINILVLISPASHWLILCFASTLSHGVNSDSGVKHLETCLLLVLCCVDKTKFSGCELTCCSPCWVLPTILI